MHLSPPPSAGTLPDLRLRLDLAGFVYVNLQPATATHQNAQLHIYSHTHLHRDCDNVVSDTEAKALSILKERDMARAGADLAVNPAPIGRLVRVFQSDSVSNPYLL